MQRIFLPLLFALVTSALGLRDEGKWNRNLTRDESSLILSKNLYKDADPMVYIKLNCETIQKVATNLTLRLAIVQSPCWDYSQTVKVVQHLLLFPSSSASKPNITTHYFHPPDKVAACDDHIIMEKTVDADKPLEVKTHQHIYKIPSDGVYVLGFYVLGDNFNLEVTVEIKSYYGYLSAADWPLLRFYGFMCIFYIILGLAWLVMSFLQWRDLLRVQFWIGGVILLGMLEKATFYAEYQSINNTGYRVQGAMIFAEWVSCAKRTLARMLVVIVSLGFGIVKPSLGAALHRVVGVGLLYFFLAAAEAYLRVTHNRSDQDKDLLVASVPLAVLDSAICLWIFTALVNTTRTLRLRRNEVKLTLYRHFTNTLIFAIIASVIFMLYSIKTHRLVSCLTVWKDLWLEEAYWHILFSALLLVIMILWRPTNNNQRYAFVPLLENGDEEEEEHLVNDAYGVKVRLQHQRSTTPKSNSVEEDLKWLEENVTIDPPLPVFDSDEELVNTMFEVSKMQ